MIRTEINLTGGYVWESDIGTKNGDLDHVAANEPAEEARGAKVNGRPDQW